MRVVNINTDQVSGILTYPDQTSSGMPAVLLLHGFAADKNEVNNTFQHVAKELAAQGVASLRIDFRGDTDNKIFSIHEMVADAQAGHTLLSRLPEIDPEKISVIGFSLGSTIALLLSQKASCHSLCLLSPTLNLLKDFTGFLGAATIEQLSSCGQYAEVTLPWKTIQLSRAFYESLSDCNPLAAAECFAGNLLCIAGTEDFSAPNARTIDESTHHIQQKETIIISGADHIFSKEVSDVIKKTAEWIALSMQPTAKHSCGMY